MGAACITTFPEIVSATADYDPCCPAICDGNKVSLQNAVHWQLRLARLFLRKLGRGVCMCALPQCSWNFSGIGHVLQTSDQFVPHNLLCCSFHWFVGSSHSCVGVHMFGCVRACVRACVCVLCIHCMRDWTLGAAVHPSKKLAMSVRRHTKVLADGEVIPGCSRPRAPMADCVLCQFGFLPAACIFFTGLSCNPFCLWGFLLLTTSPVLWSICSRVRLVLFSLFCFGRDEVCVYYIGVMY